MGGREGKGREGKREGRGREKGGKGKGKGGKGKGRTPQCFLDKSNVDHYGTCAELLEFTR